MGADRLAMGVWPILVTPFDEDGAPPPFARSGPALVDHYRTIAEVGLPIVVQDYPPETTVLLSAEMLAEIVAACGPRAGV
jgi:dihydrodipicolinate synthase/N-acetylneuraminate lyase